MWATLEQARQTWPDAPGDDVVLTRLLEAAQEQAEAFAPVPGDIVPARYTEAVILQARDLAAAATRTGDVVGIDDYPIRVRPLSGTVKQLLRPKQGRPRFGGSTTPTTTILDGGAP